MHKKVTWRGLRKHLKRNAECPRLRQPNSTKHTHSHHAVIQLCKVLRARETKESDEASWSLPPTSTPNSGSVCTTNTAVQHSSVQVCDREGRTRPLIRWNTTPWLYTLLLQLQLLAYGTASDHGESTYVWSDHRYQTLSIYDQIYRHALTATHSVSTRTHRSSREGFAVWYSWCNNEQFGERFAPPAVNFSCRAAGSARELDLKSLGPVYI